MCLVQAWAGEGEHAVGMGEILEVLELASLPSTVGSHWSHSLALQPQPRAQTSLGSVWEDITLFLSHPPGFFSAFVIVSQCVAQCHSFACTCTFTSDQSPTQEFADFPVYNSGGRCGGNARRVLVSVEGLYRADATCSLASCLCPEFA